MSLQTPTIMTEQQAKQNLEFADYLESQVKDKEFVMEEYGKKTPCGTSCCVAGHRAVWPKYPMDYVWILNGAALDLRRRSNSTPHTFSHYVAQEMGLNDGDEAGALFYNYRQTRAQAATLIRRLTYKYHPDIVKGYEHDRTASA